MIRLVPLLFVLVPFLAPAGEVSPFLRNPPPDASGSPSFKGESVRAVVRLAGAVDAGALEALQRAGAEPVRLPSGALAVVGNAVSVRLPPHRIDAVAALPGVMRLDPARPVFRMAPLHRTAVQVQAPRLWYPPADLLEGRPFGNLGEGVVVADHEGGWDPFHPDFFRPDAGRYDFEDVDRDGVAGEGDRVDLDGDGVFESRLSLLEGLRSDNYTGEFEFHDHGYQPDVDWLYVDEDNNGERDFGAARGFSDDVPAFGEPIFAADDADGDGMITPGEKLLRLGTSKVRAISIDQTGKANRIYRRGEDLSSFPVKDFDDSSRGHGTGAIGIVASGWPGVRRYTGLAPGVELLLIGHEDVVSSVAEARALGSDVNFYEWCEFISPQDGSGISEYVISEAGGVNVAAAGNLAGADHVLEISPLGTVPEIAPIAIDGYGYYKYRSVWLNLTWTGGADEVAWSIVGTDGSRFDASGDAFAEGQVAGLTVQAWTEVTDRGHTWVTVGMGKRGFGYLPEMTLALEVHAVSGSVERFRGIVVDDQSGWGKGVSWLEHLADAGSALSPSTSDRVIAVAAHGGTHDFTLHGWGDVGERRAYSGMGPRIDGVPVIDISGPDDPYSPRSDSEATYGAYGAFGGTSGALPHVAASAALILAERPALGHDEVEALLKAGTLVDEFTGIVPNEAFGHGKVRVARALGLEPHGTSDGPRIALSAKTAMVGEEAEIIATVEPEGTVVGFDLGNDGIEEMAPSLDGRFAFVPEKARKVPVAGRAIGPDGRQARSVLLVDVRANCATTGCAEGMVCGSDGRCVEDEGGDDGGGDGDAADGGCGGCTTDGSVGTGASVLSLLALVLLSRRRRR